MTSDIFIGALAWQILGGRYHLNGGIAGNKIDTEISRHFLSDSR
jgi:hypothetical protein